MNLPAPPRAGLPTVGVTVFDSATVFDGLRPSDVIYRYDLPGTGISEGWAASAVVDQVRQLCSGHWPDVQVRIDASPAITDTLQRLLATKGVSASGFGDTPPGEGTPDEGVDEGSDEGGEGRGAAGGADEPGGASDTAPGGQRRSRGGRHRLERGSASGGDPAHQRARILLIVAGAAIFLILLGAGWWWYASGSRENEATAGSAGAAGVAASAAPDEGQAPDSVSLSPEQPEQSGSPEASESDEGDEQPRPTVQLEHGELAVTLPLGFQVAAGEDSVVATGADPDLRIHLAMDPLYSIDRETLFDEIERLAARDPELTEPHRGATHFEYTEHPGDGSQVRWTTWVDGGQQLSVGCHTRVEPTAAQHAACSIATGSLSLRG